MKRGGYKVANSDLFETPEGGKFEFGRRYEDHPDPAQRRPYCIEPGCNKIAHNKGKDHGGFMRHCYDHYYGKANGGTDYRKYKDDRCANEDGRLGFKCTTTIIDPCMMTVDHIDEHHNNSDPKNLQSLCACCQNYKSKFFRKFRNMTHDEIWKVFNKNIKKQIDATLFGDESK